MCNLILIRWPVEGAIGDRLGRLRARFEAGEWREAAGGRGREMVRRGCERRSFGGGGAGYDGHGPHFTASNANRSSECEAYYSWGGGQTESHYFGFAPGCCPAARREKN